MKSIFTRLMIGLIAILVGAGLGLITQSWANTGQPRLVVKGKIPQGAIITSRKVILKKGYKFDRVSKSKVNVVARMPGGRTGITGTFECTCNGASGGCDVVITGSSVSCATGTSCKSSYYMITTIPSPSGSVMH